MALAGLGVSLAGFAGLIAALAPRTTAHPAVAFWRIRNIVIGGFTLTIAGFATVALYTATGEGLALTVRLSSLLLILPNIAFYWRESRPGAAWPSEANRRFAMGSSALLILATLLNVWLGRLGYLQILFVVHLLDPLSIFVNTVRDVAGSDRRE